MTEMTLTSVTGIVASLRPMVLLLTIRALLRRGHDRRRARSGDNQIALASLEVLRVSKGLSPEGEAEEEEDKKSGDELEAFHCDFMVGVQKEKDK